VCDDGVHQVLKAVCRNGVVNLAFTRIFPDNREIISMALADYRE